MPAFCELAPPAVFAVGEVFADAEVVVVEVLETAVAAAPDVPAVLDVVDPEVVWLDVADEAPDCVELDDLLDAVPGVTSWSPEYTCGAPRARGHAEANIRMLAALAVRPSASRCF